MEKEFYNYIAQAEHLIDIDRDREAVPLLSKALAIDPDSFYVCGLISSCFLNIGALEDAMKFADKAVELEPDDEWGHRLRSLVYSEKGWNREALESAKEAVRLQPEEPLALERLASSYLSVNKPKEAKKISDELLEVAPYSEVSHFTAGNVSLALNDNWEAEQAFKRALEINPTSPGSQNNLGVAVLRQETGKATSYFGFSSPSVIQYADNLPEQLFENALRIDPNNKVAAKNYIHQHSYAVALVPIFAFIPFMMMGFFVIPLGALISYGLTTFWSIKAANDVRKKRDELTDEMRSFVSTGWIGEDGVLDVFSNSLWTVFKKTWKPHLLALSSVLLTSAAFAYSMPGLRLLSILMMLGAFWWLAFESRKVD